MKFLHTSDWHLGMMLQAGKSYAADQRFAYEQICRIALEEKVDGMIIAGDVFDKRIASQEALSLYDEFVTHICLDLDIPLYIIAGNHDGAERISQCNELLKKSGLYIAGMLAEKAQVVNNGDVDIFMLPWISTEKVISVYPEEGENVKNLEDAYRIVLDKYRAMFVEGHKNILISHAYVRTAETSVSDRTAEIGGATMVDASVFEGFDYVALGHLHAPQSIGKNIRYSGTPMAYSFGKEEEQTKSVTVYDTESGEQKIIPLDQLHVRKTLKGTYEKLMKADFDEDILNGYVRLEVSDSYVGLESMALFREKYANLLEISGLDYNNENMKITMTVDEYEQNDSDPGVIFRHYCMDVMGSEPDEHKIELFNKAIEDYLKGENE